MPRSGITVYLPPALEERIAGLAKERHCSESSLIADAVKGRFDKRTLETANAAERARFRADARLDKVIGEALILDSDSRGYHSVGAGRTDGLDDVRYGAACSG